MNKNRLEAFSDGVLAIIITIMVLELKVPPGDSRKVLFDMFPVFFGYALSFVYIGIYWGNHHHLLHTVKNVTPGIMWANLHLLFWLSLVPFATGWMGENHFSRNPVAVYAVLLVLCGLAFSLLQAAITSSHTYNETMLNAFKKVKYKEWFSTVAYLSAIGLTFVNPMISCFLFVVVAVVWIIPEKHIEQALKE